MKSFSQLILITLAFLIGGWFSYQYFKGGSKPIENSTVLLEQIRAVTKLSTIEGQFSEVYNYSEYQGYFTFFWDKKILVRVRATVSAGYDLNGFHIEADPLTKTVKMSGFPAAQILSIDHNLDYYDVSEGLFTNFSSEDYNRINLRAKDLIREQAIKSNLLAKAEEQGKKMTELIQFMVQSAGWNLQMTTPTAPTPLQ